MWNARARSVVLVFIGTLALCGVVMAQGSGLPSGEVDDDSSIELPDGSVCNPVGPTLLDLGALVAMATSSGDEPDMSGPPPTWPNGQVIPGWRGKITFPTGTQCDFQNWDDSDGIVPDVPGCHYEYEGKDGDVCSSPTNDFFGEACQDDDILIETNPEKDKCHVHANSEGHPDLFSCSAFCQGQYGLAGKCVPSPNTCNRDFQVVHSAFCHCGCEAFDQTGGSTIVDCDTQVCCLFDDGDLEEMEAGACDVAGGESRLDFEDCFGIPAL